MQSIDFRLIQLYLQEKLWDKLREENGFCYDLEVGYSYFTYGTAPFMMIYFQTLPKDTGTAICQVIKTLEELAQTGADQTILSELLTREQRLVELRNGSTKDFQRYLCYMALFKQEWLRDSSLYLSKLNQVKQDSLAGFMADKLKDLKIVVAGPIETKEFLKGAQALIH